ncbi:MAG: hypothetical protein A2X22_09835 [Bacteroidetes bacterium GWF2_49_14]|nr:MAG: hypothetical protein A2X22_09835 [Bacteroidetes bacterium GWF2_49_14]HBB91361.1 hypothetical protein [Bacteroidales bacterium]
MMEPYLKVYESLTTEQKSDFLLKALAASKLLQKQLVGYFGDPGKGLRGREPSFDFRVQQAANRIRKKLDAIDLEDLDYGSYRPSGRYMDQWEVDYELAQTEINEVIATISADIALFIRAGEMGSFLAEYTGCMIAIRQAEIDDPNSIMEDPTDELWESFREATKDFESEIRSVVLNPSGMGEVVTILMGWFLSHQNENLSTGLLDQLTNVMVKHSGLTLSPLKMSAEDFCKASDSFPKTYLAILRNSDIATWKSEAERLATSSPDIARELLEYGYENAPEFFYQKAGPFFHVFSQELFEFLADRLDPVRDRALARNVLEYKVIKKNSLSDYKILATLFDTDADKEVLLKKLEGLYNDCFLVEVLEYERRYEDILKLARRPNRFISDYEFLLAPIVDIYPGECFQIITKMVNREMNSEKLSRSNYERIASLLGIIDKVPAIKPEVRVFVRQLIQAHPRRSALRQELQKMELF